MRNQMYVAYNMLWNWSDCCSFYLEQNFPHRKYADRFKLRIFQFPVHLSWCHPSNLFFFLPKESRKTGCQRWVCRILSLFTWSRCERWSLGNWALRQQVASMSVAYRGGFAWELFEPSPEAEKWQKVSSSSHVTQSSLSALLLFASGCQPVNNSTCREILKGIAETSSSSSFHILCSYWPKN